MSRFSFFYLLFWFQLLIPLCFGQQRENDFTKRVRTFDGKINALSSKKITSSRINSFSNKRFSVREWPSKFSPFGGKRYPVQGKEILGEERIKTSNIEVKLPHNQNYASENSKRAITENNINSSPAAASIEFRDAYYAQLGKRVDDWMNKVNNISLRDINRFQFRKGRPSEPGFPVQKAGSKNLPLSPSEKKLGSSNVRGVIPSSQKNSGSGRSGYWLGPKKIESSSTAGKVSPSSSFQSQSSQVKKNFKSFPKPVLGPKKVRVKLK